MRSRHNPWVDGKFVSDITSIWSAAPEVAVTYEVKVVDNAGNVIPLRWVPAEQVATLREAMKVGKIQKVNIVRQETTASPHEGSAEAPSSGPIPRVRPQARPASDTSDPPPPDAATRRKTLREMAAEAHGAGKHSGLTPTTYAKAYHISRVLGNFKHCRGKKASRGDKTPLVTRLLANGIDAAKADKIIEMFKEMDYLRVRTKTKSNTDGLMLQVEEYDGVTVDALWNQWHGIKNKELLKTMRAYHPETGEELGTLSTVITDMAHKQRIQEHAATFLLVKEGLLDCDLVATPTATQYNPRGSRSRALNNSGYPDTMIPLPYPRKDYEFAPPPVVAHYTSYPQFAYDQFYPDPGRLAWTGPTSAPQENPSKTRGRKPRKNPLRSFPSPVHKSSILEPQLLDFKNLIPSDKIWIGYQVYPDNLTAAQKQQYKDKKYVHIFVATTDPRTLPPGYPTRWSLYEPGVNYKGLDGLPDGLAPGQVWSIAYKQIRIMP